MILLLAAVCLAQVAALVIQAALHSRERRESDKAIRLLLSRIEGRPDPDRPTPSPSPRPVPLGDDKKIVALQKGLNGDN